jgi:alkylation response protein AidB-like acyl-CoA dehydrogenase
MALAETADLARLYRDTPQLIGEETSEIRRTVIGRDLLERPQL